MSDSIDTLPPALFGGMGSLGPPYAEPTPTTPLREPRLLHLNTGLVDELGLDAGVLASAEGLARLSGNAPWPGFAPLSTVYAGHQFGVFVPQLGDGRAHLVAQVATPEGSVRELQLKGAGPTPYSRFADGRAVLRSSIREYLCSEAMHALGIPTTRALALVGSPQPVRRETVETAAIVCRVAPAFVRFGHFEFYYYQDAHERLAPLADNVIATHFPELAAQPDRHARWLAEVVERTARLMAQWQAVGFCHGVMNTDNFSVLGLTLDYGPFGFMDAFDARHICNHTDENGRYAWDQQPQVGHWNCSRLLQATLPLLDAEPEPAVEIATDILGRYPVVYAQAMTRRWADKLGLADVREGDAELINRYLGILHAGHSDFTRSFRHLSRLAVDSDAPAEGIREEMADLARFDAWIADYRVRLRAESSDDAGRARRMDAVNPRYVLRNHLAQAAIEQAQANDPSEVARLFTLLREPYREQAGMDAYAAEPAAGLRHLEVSCSS